jgi:hypothetical protein
VNIARIRGIAALSAVAFLLAPGLGSAQTVAVARPDVLVVGGTPAGVAAAVTAARDGETVTLVSAKGDLGGTLTDAMMDQWDLNTGPGGASLQAGLFQEIYARLGDAFTPEAAATTFADLVAQEPGITVRYDESPIAVKTVQVREGARIAGVTFVDMRDGMVDTLGALFVIDATDAGDVAALAGARYDVGRQDTGLDERAQAVTEIFTFEGVDWSALANSYDVARYGPGGVLGRRAWGYADLMRGYRAASPGVVVRDLNLGLLSDGSVTVNAVDVCGIDGLDAHQLADAKRQTEVEAPRLLAYLRERVNGFADARVGIFAPSVYVRETRHIEGVERLTADDVWLGRIPADSIGLSSYPLDLHPVDPTDEQAYAPERHVYGIPFGALVPKGFTNLLLASPAISASHVASGSARVIPTTIEEGEADGHATAVALRHDETFVDLVERPSAIAIVRVRETARSKASA